jgi:hypothetical protein
MTPLTKEPTALRLLLNRTGGLVSASRLPKLWSRGEDPSDADEPKRGLTAPDRRGVPRERVEPDSDGDRSSWFAARLAALRLDRLATLAERATTTVTVDGSTLRLLTIANDRIVGWTSIPLPERAARAGQINDPVALGTAIDDAFDEFRLSRRRVVWALPGFQSTARILDLPGLRGQELRQAIEEEFERILGASTNDFYLSWQRLTGRVRQRRVFVLAVPRSVVLAALEALEVARIRPVTMDLRPLAIVRAIGRSDAIVANLEEGSLDLVIVEHGVPALIRSLPLVGSAAARDAAQTRLVEETERTLAYYDDANPDHPLDVDAPLFLTGSLATGIALAERMRAVTRHPIGRVHALGNYPSELPAAEYLVNLGLSLKQG